MNSSSSEGKQDAEQKHDSSALSPEPRTPQKMGYEGG